MVGPIMRCAVVVALGVAVVSATSGLTSLGSNFFDGLYNEKLKAAPIADSSSWRYGVDKSFPMHSLDGVNVDNADDLL